MANVVGGIEGGGTQSTIILYNVKGEVLAEKNVETSLNHWLHGMEECQTRINALVKETLRDADLPEDLTLAALGLSLSGCEQEESNAELKEGLQRRFPGLSRHYVVCSDTVGCIKTALKNGGICLISGTGSNSLLLNPDLSVYRCGGWGHMLGDEGGAWWISHQAVKMLIDDEDNIRKPPHSIRVARRCILEHFNIKDRFGLLEVCYTNFQKAHYAGLCAKLAKEAGNGDPLCRWIFRRAGHWLGAYVSTLLPNVHQSLLTERGGLHVVCVGSVWKSWPLLKEGFLDALSNDSRTGVGVDEVTLLQVSTTAAAGAAYLAADDAMLQLSRDYSKNSTVLFHDKGLKSGKVVSSVAKSVGAAGSILDDETHGPSV